MKRPLASLGFRAHSGWAALIAIAGTHPAIEVVARQRVDLADPSVPGPRQPYHEAEGEPLARARRIVERYADESRRRALESLRAVLGDLRSKGYEVIGCGLLLASNRPLPQLESILASHALIHAADGELFRDAIADAGRTCGLPVLRVRERELYDRAASVLNVSEATLRKRVADLGRLLGPLWTQDQKLATVAAWTALRSGAG